MSSNDGERPKLHKDVATDTEAEHSMVSGDDQQIVEERERQRDAISNAKPRRTDDDATTGADSAGKTPGSKDMRSES